MTKERLELGRYGEELALKSIQRLGYKKVVRNYTCPMGEVDLIAMDGDTLVFIEIKTRKNKPIAFAKEVVTAKKQRQLSKAALAFMKSNDCCEAKARFDVVAVSLKGGKKQIEVIKNAFELNY